MFDMSDIKFLTYSYTVDDCVAIPDLWDSMVLRFDVGFPVLIKTQIGWEALTVNRVWPIERLISTAPSISTVRLISTAPSIDITTAIPHYNCDPYTVSLDSEHNIRERWTVFRFTIGESIIFDSTTAIGTSQSARKLLSKADRWVNGIVTAVDVVQQPYAPYMCSFDIDGKPKQCYIVIDDDEHITGAETTPREKLLDAIFTDCTPEHLTYLTSFYSIDISVIRDLVIEKAIKAGSYNVSMVHKI